MTTSPTSAPTVTTARLGTLVLLTGAVFGVLDALWLGVVSGSLYEDRIGQLLAEQANVGAAAAFYVVYVLGLVHFVVRPGLGRASLPRALADAAGFGLVTYATFDLTSMAVFRDFPLEVVVVDMAWGALVCTATTAVVLGVLRRRWGAPTDR